jgi:RNAse (barnase) inhibitor barstar
MTAGKHKPLPASSVLALAFNHRMASRADVEAWLDAEVARLERVPDPLLELYPLHVRTDGELVAYLQGAGAPLSGADMRSLELGCMGVNVARTDCNVSHALNESYHFMTIHENAHLGLYEAFEELEIEWALHCEGSQQHTREWFRDALRSLLAPHRAWVEREGPLYVIEIDGARTDSVESFYDEFDRQALDAWWGRNLDAFNDVLRGGFGTPEGGFLLRWRNHRDAREGLGAEVFDLLLSIIRAHGPSGDESGDNVFLELA